MKLPIMELMNKITGVILSGGLAKRFQKNNEHWIDKATVEIEGKPILIRLIETLEKVTKEVIIIVNNEERKQSYLELIKKYKLKPVKIFLDEKANCKGPLLGILTGMKKVETDYCLILPCDLPYMKVDTLGILYEDLSEKGITVFIHDKGEIEPLPACISIKNSLEIIKLICKLEKRRIDDFFRGYTELVLTVSWRIQDFDPYFKSFVNLNYQGGLEETVRPYYPRGTIANSYPLRTEEKIFDHLDQINTNIDNFKPNNLEPILKIISELKTKNLFYWIATLYEFLGRYNSKYLNEAAEFYLKESKFYSERGIYFLVRHAELDQKWCLEQLEKKF